MKTIEDPHAHLAGTLGAMRSIASMGADYTREQTASGSFVAMLILCDQAQAALEAICQQGGTE
uniref:Uncharacterized protein n=1 Tax=Haliea sp. ETY-M TaxID=1055105 RepID=A0A455R2Y3_9GAMM|nr:hypothetical protein [Haliea sp. ETY-M]